MRHRIKCMYINFQQNGASRSVKTVHTNLFANNHKLHRFATCNSKNRSFQTRIIQFPILELILRSIASADVLEPRSKVISTDDGRTDVSYINRYFFSK